MGGGKSSKKKKKERNDYKIGKNLNFLTVLRKTIYLGVTLVLSQVERDPEQKMLEHGGSGGELVLTMLHFLRYRLSLV